MGCNAANPNELWSNMRQSGKEIMYDPKYKVQLAELEAGLKKKSVHVNPEYIKRIRHDILESIDENADYEYAASYATEHFEEFNNITAEELKWLNQWACTYTVSCEGDCDETNKLGQPYGIKDVDYIMYVMIGGLPPDNWSANNPFLPYCLLFEPLISIKRKYLRVMKQETIKSFVRDNPDLDECCRHNQIHPNYRHIACKVEWYEIVTYWRNHIWKPRESRRLSIEVYNTYVRENNQPPKCGKDCISIIRGIANIEHLEARIITCIDNRIYNDHLISYINQTKPQ